MNKGKKFIAMGLSAMMLISMTACGGSSAAESEEGAKMGAKVESENTDSESVTAEQAGAADLPGQFPLGTALTALPRDTLQGSGICIAPAMCDA